MSFVIKFIRRLFLLGEPTTWKTVFYRTAAMFLIMLGFLTFNGVKEGLIFGAPPHWTDGHDYDNLAVSIMQGEGMQFDFTDPEWRRQYLADPDESKHEILSRNDKGPTAFRAAGFPTILASLYLVFGHDFAVVRIFNMFCLALAAALAVGIAEREKGWAAALLLSILFLCFEHGYNWHAFRIMSEAAACLLMTTWLFACSFVIRKPTLLNGAIAGLVFGAACHVRSSFVLMLPFLLVTVAVWCWFEFRKKRSEATDADSGADAKRPAWFRSPRVQAATIGFLVVFAFMAPWWVRNCMVIGKLAPLGSLGKISLSGAYSDEAYEHGGNWDFSSQERTWIEASQTEEYRQSAKPTQEYLVGQLATEKAWAWVTSNPEKLPRMAAMRIYSLFSLDNFFDLLRFCALPVAIIFAWRITYVRFLTLILLFQTLIVVMTWSHYGRFLFPFRPMLHVLLAIGWVTAAETCYAWFWPKPSEDSIQPIEANT